MVLPALKQLTSVCFVAGSCLLLAPVAKADLLVNIINDHLHGRLKVEVTGRFDSLPHPHDWPDPNKYSCGSDGLLTQTSICTGPDHTDNLYFYDVSGSPDSLPLSKELLQASTFEGSTFALLTADNAFPFYNLTGVLFSYTPGNPFYSLATYDGESLSSIGLQQGLIGEWQLTNSEKIVLMATPAPSPLPLLGAASAFGFSRRLRKRITQRLGG